MKTNPSNFLGLRLPENILNKLKAISTQNNETPVQTGKKAIIEWIEVLFTARNLNMIILPKATLIKIINFLNETQIQELSGDIAQNLTEFYKFFFLTHKEHLPLESFTEFTMKFLGSSGLMWFDSLLFSTESDKKTVQGSHHLGKKWSLFSGYTLQKLFIENVNAKIVKDTIFYGENLITFHFQ